MNLQDKIDALEKRIEYLEHKSGVKKKEDRIYELKKRNIELQSKVEELLQIVNDYEDFKE